MKKTAKKVDTIEKLAQVVSVSFEDLQSEMESRFTSLESEVRNGFIEQRRMLNRIDTRLTALELAVFGATGAGGGRIVANSLLSRLDKLERAVFKK